MASMKVYGKRGHYLTVKVLAVAGMCGASVTVLPGDESPTGKVPCVECEEGVIQSSNAILRWLAASHADKQLYGSTALERAHVDGWLDVCMLELDTPAAVLTYGELGYVSKDCIRPVVRTAKRK